LFNEGAKILLFLKQHQKNEKILHKKHLFVQNRFKNAKQ